MGFFTLLEVASMPVLQVLIIGLLGAFLASEYSNILNSDARKHMNKIVFAVFTPSLMFASLAKSVTLQDLISWWFMPINVGLTFLFGGILGWIVVKTLKPKPYLEGLVIATCSSGNLGNIMLIIIPSICEEEGNPFGKPSVCSVNGAAYASFSMALGGYYIWTYTYHLIRTSSIRYKEMESSHKEESKIPNNDSDGNIGSLLLKVEDQDLENDINAQVDTPSSSSKSEGTCQKLRGLLLNIVDELLAPPTVAAVVGMFFGATQWMKSLIIGTSAPLRVIQESVQLLGDGTIPSITLILGGNLTQGLRKSKLKKSIIIAVLCVRYTIMPVIGISVVRAAAASGFLSRDPLYHFILMLQYTVPPAMNIGTMTQLFDVGQEECSVLFLWTYLVAALALTIWSTIYMWILS